MRSAEFINRLCVVFFDAYFNASLKCIETSTGYFQSTGLDWGKLFIGEKSPSPAELRCSMCDVTVVWWCCWEKVIVINDALRGPGWKTIPAATLELEKIFSFCSLPVIFQQVFPPTPSLLRLTEVNRATSSWLPNMKRFPKVQDSSLISSQALRLPASPALLALSLSIHLPLLALSPAAHLSAPFASNTAGPWHTC